MEHQLSQEEIFNFQLEVHEAEGAWLYFDKLPPAEEEDPKKKAPVKGKVNVEETKPTHGKVWINFKSFQKGDFATTYETRSLVSTVLKLPEG